ncbi:terminase small subunit [Polynucleobacter sp.]|uniref:terminase small subunit n=1 Tax=Polynucleobacter sp. TaxID=2029855 RepID=UPI003F6A164F
MLSPKQEAFVQAIVTGVSQSDAYRAAFNVGAKTKPETVNQAASRLMANSNITARVVELRKQVAEIAQITLKSHLDDLLRLRNMAAKEKQYSAAISAEVARGKASGVHIEKQETNITGGLNLNVQFD